MSNNKKTQNKNSLKQEINKLEREIQAKNEEIFQYQQMNNKDLNKQSRDRKITKTNTLTKDKPPMKDHVHQYVQRIQRMPKTA